MLLHHPESIIEYNSHCNVKDNVGPEDPKIMTTLTPVHVSTRQALIRSVQGVELADIRRARVLGIPRSSWQIRAQILATGHATRRIKVGDFDITTPDGAIMHLCDGNTSDPICKGQDTVYENPKPWEGLGVCIVPLKVGAETSKATITPAVSAAIIIWAKADA